LSRARAYRLAALSLIVAVACGGRKPSNEDNSMAKKPPPQLEVVREEMPDPGWTRAYDLALPDKLKQDLRAAGATKVALRPARIGGQLVPYFVEIEGDQISNRVLVTAAGTAVDFRNGRAGLESYLREIGFPAQRLHQDMLVALLGYFSVLSLEWQRPSPSEGEVQVELQYREGGAHLRLQKLGASGGGATGGGYAGPRPAKLEIDFDAQARITLTQWIDRGDGWEQVK
jgi:hypothetical protein